ncbi:hypothetical protein BGZ63DRAFT_409668 [Mariannaea sp. PMI_226]|nr:hypothetical protein BGZ63DRAFT_409668 [Mariannaea sp. PMI_226]
MSSWLPISPKSHFSLANIPFGIISSAENTVPRPGVAIGDYVLDLKAFAQAGGFSASVSIQPHISVFLSPSLNAFAALGRPFHRLVREYLQSVLAIDTELAHVLKENTILRQSTIILRSDVTNHLPLEIGDYTDFYAGLNHAYNVGVLFRGLENALQPNYKHLPVAYHGRSSSVVISGTPIRRPWGQILQSGEKFPTLKPCEKLDFELELGMFICQANPLGSPIPVSRAEDHIFGYVLVNDWSARDIQAWEYVPLGPFTSKNLGTSISPWVVLADALEQTKQPGINNDAVLLPYLKEENKANVLNIDLEIDLTTNGQVSTIAKTNTKELLWSWPQMIAHHTITGCPLRTGDLFGSGTISGTSIGTEGSLLERTKGGKESLALQNGQTRSFLQDGDSITIRGWARQGDVLIGFGEVFGNIDKPLSLSQS